MWTQCGAPASSAAANQTELWLSCGRRGTRFNPAQTLCRLAPVPHFTRIRLLPAPTRAIVLPPRRAHSNAHRRLSPDPTLIVLSSEQVASMRPSLENDTPRTVPVCALSTVDLPSLEGNMWSARRPCKASGSHGNAHMRGGQWVPVHQRTAWWTKARMAQGCAQVRWWRGREGHSSGSPLSWME